MIKTGTKYTLFQMMKTNSKKDKLIEIWLYCVAIAFTIAAFCTFAAWVMGLAICIVRLING